MPERFRDESAGQYACDFLETLTHTRGEWAGQPFRLIDWQRAALMDFYSTMEPDDDGNPVRSFQYLYVEIGKKNGKSELASGLGLYHLVGDGERSPLVLLCSSDQKNARTNLWLPTKAMADELCSKSKYWRKRLKIVDSMMILRDNETGGELRCISSEAHTKHGYNSSCVIFDELHAQPNRQLWDLLTFGSGSARRQPVWIVLTTAGDDPDRKSIGWEIHEKARRIRDWRRQRDGLPDPMAAFITPERDDAGNIIQNECETLSEADDDPIWLPVIYGVGDLGDKKIDISNEELWKLCNPSLGVTLKMRTLRQEARAAAKSEAQERLFRWLRLNQWISTKAVGWIPLSIYDKTQWNGDKNDLLGKKCFGGLDLSSTTDLSAFVLVFPPQDGLDTWVMLPRAWRPLDTVSEAEARDHVSYTDWARAGYLDLCPGDMVDFDAIEQYITQCREKYKLQLVGVDPYLSRMLTGHLGELGVPVAEIPPTMKNMSPPMKQLEALIREHKMLHVHNTCARWCFGNVRCFVDGNENLKPMKNKSTGRIDITVAWIIAMAASALKSEPDINDVIAERGYAI